MNTAITVWNGRIAPVFDEAGKCLITGDNAETNKVVSLPDQYEEKAIFLQEKGIKTLICGAISCECERCVLDRGITVIPFIAGNIDEVLNAWKENRLLTHSFSMPGCGCPRRRRRRRGRQGHSSILQM